MKDEEYFDEENEELLEEETLSEDYEENPEVLAEDSQNIETQESHQRNQIDYQNYYRRRYEAMNQNNPNNQNNASINRLRNNNMNRMSNNMSRNNFNNKSSGQSSSTQGTASSNASGNALTKNSGSSSTSLSKNNNKQNKKGGRFLEKSKSNEKEKGKSSFDLFGKTKGKLNALKIKIYLVIAGILAFLFLIVFIIVILDSLMSNILELTNWNFGSTSNNENINSDSNYSNDDSKELNGSNLGTLINANDLDSLTSKITNAGKDCSGTGVASRVVALIDGLNKFGYKIPYSNNAGDNTLTVNPNWGKDENGNIIGFNDITFMNWALNASNIENKVTDINEYKDYVLPISLEYSKPGDIIIYQNNVYMILQNIGSSVIIAYVANDGLTYKNYSFDDLKNYDVYNMNLYYIDNCNN